ncbi:glycosyltransferase family 2 protein [Butyrivibrio sp. WCE2006]|uniref:glycosyltransferase family 2 protein n=1 Tax=Butyrivibrio sp. WCE2006 TaxID=1410611 RepID=UPI0006789EA6|nr:glycosyltransferase [Butyrivibrio sp. WCE2006]
MNKVSIIVPIYNGEKYIDNCVKNLKAQSYSDLEFILVDDGSTDKTPQICDDYAIKDERFKVVHQKNGGLSAARNAGTNAATGDYIVYVDVDDDIESNLVEDNVKLAIENDADVVFYSFWYHNLDTGIRTENKYNGYFCGNDEEFFCNKLNDTVDTEVFNAPWNKLYKISFLKENNLIFLPEYPIYEDIIFASKMLQYAKRIVVNPNRYYVYYLRSSGSLLTKYVDGYYDSVTKFYDNSMDYCELHKNNQMQKNKLSNLYIRLVTTNLKQISCREQFSLKEKLNRISYICNYGKFQEALGSDGIEKRKKLIRFLVLTKNYIGILVMYRIRNTLKI